MSCEIRWDRAFRRNSSLCVLSMVLYSYHILIHQGAMNTTYGTVILVEYYVLYEWVTCCNHGWNQLLLPYDTIECVATAAAAAAVNSSEWVCGWRMQADLVLVVAVLLAVPPSYRLYQGRHSPEPLVLVHAGRHILQCLSECLHLLLQASLHIQII